LRDVELGPFSIQLHLGRLRRRNSSCFDCVALQPHPADGNSNVTHPHVSDKVLCAGDATVPIASALKEGRIADAFCLVNAVLKEYNAGSPHISLDDWNGGNVHCQDCDRQIHDDDVYHCDDCERQCCDGCTRCCAGCERIFCDNCLEQDEDAGEYFCSKCRRRCANCDRIVALTLCDPKAELCRDCLEARKNDSTQDNQPKERHEPTEQPDQAVPAREAATG
jgi:hypothetical protein